MSDLNPYATPQSAIHEAAQAALEVPEDILKHIKHGWIAALVSGSLTLVITMAGMAGDMANAGTHALNFVDVLLIFGLAFGIYRKSRAAATAMFFYFLLSKIIAMVDTGMPSGLVLGLVFLIFYFRAMTATYRYHRFVRHAMRFPPPPKVRISDDPLFRQPPPTS